MLQRGKLCLREMRVSSLPKRTQQSGLTPLPFLLCKHLPTGPNIQVTIVMTVTVCFYSQLFPGIKMHSLESTFLLAPCLMSADLA